MNYVDTTRYDVKNLSRLKRSGFKFNRMPPLPDSVVIDNPNTVTSETIDIAADIAVADFFDRFAAVLQTSGFID